MNTKTPLVTVVIPSYNQGNFLSSALSSVFDQSVAVETIVVDGGSSDNSIEVIKNSESQLFWWRSCKDNGQAAAINEGVAKGRAPFICWLNSDDRLLPGAIDKLLKALDMSATAPAAYGKCLIIDKDGKKKKEYWTARFSEKHLANRCFISQPATLIRRDAWEQVGGLDESLHMSLDYDLWWRLYRYYGKFQYTEELVAASRDHGTTKTNVFRHAHYRESMMVVKKYYGFVPLKWYLAYPIKVIYKHFFNKYKRKLNL